MLNWSLEIRDGALESSSSLMSFRENLRFEDEEENEDQRKRRKFRRKTLSRVDETTHGPARLSLLSDSLSTQHEVAAALCSRPFEPGPLKYHFR